MPVSQSALHLSWYAYCERGRVMPPLFVWLVNLSGSTRGGSIAPQSFSSNSRSVTLEPASPPLDTPQPCLTSSREAGPRRAPPRWTAQFSGCSLGFISRPHRPKSRSRNCTGSHAEGALTHWISLPPTGPCPDPHAHHASPGGPLRRP